MAGSTLGGIAFVRIDGVQYLLRGNMKVQPATRSRAGVVGQDGVHGYTEKPEIPFVEMDLTDTGGLSILALESLINSTITVELNNGKIYTLSNAWFAGTPDLDTVEGKFQARFEGMACQELLAA